MLAGIIVIVIIDTKQQENCLKEIGGPCSSDRTADYETALQRVHESRHFHLKHPERETRNVSASDLSLLICRGRGNGWDGFEDDSVLSLFDPQSLSKYFMLLNMKGICVEEIHSFIQNIFGAYSRSNIRCFRSQTTALILKGKNS